MCNQMLRDNFQGSRSAQYPMMVKTIVSQKLVQEQLNLPVLQAFHLNLVSLGRNTALDTFHVFFQKVRGRSDLRRQFSKVYGLLFFLRLSNRV